MNKALFILSFILILSCSRHNDAERLLEKAQAVIETSPDTAVMYLDSILMPEIFLKKDSYMEYLVTKVQAKYKNYDNIKEDTNIFETKDYFDKKAQKPKANSQSLKYQMYAHLYSACVYDESGEYENAMKDYKTAFILAENMHDSLYMWRINNYMAEVFCKQTYWDEALKIYRKSIRLAKHDVEKANSYANLAQMYYMCDNNDSALFHIEKAIDIVKITNDVKAQSTIYQNAYVYHKESDKKDLAQQYLYMAFIKNQDSIKNNLYNLNILSFLIEDGNVDSAKIYVNKLKGEFDRIEITSSHKASLCEELSRYYSMIDRYDSAFYYQKELSYVLDDINKQNLKQNIYEIQQKYDYELQRNIYQKRLNKRLILTVCVSIVLLLVTIVSFITITKSKRREKDLSKQLDDLSNVKNDYDKFKYEIKESFNNSLKERLNIIRKVNIFERNNRSNKNVKDIKEYAYGSPYKTAFEASADVIELSYKDITTFVKKTFPELSETEYKVCVLSIAPISVNDIANIIELGVDSVGKARSNIRKKLKIEGKRASLSEYILERYYQREV